MEALLKPCSTSQWAPAPDRGAQIQALGLLSAGFEARMPAAAAHSRRVSHYAAGLAREIGLPRDWVERVRWAAALHDIGKVELPARVVAKPAPLSELEFAMVRRHAAIGARIVARLGDAEVAAIVHHHHERFDGRGYPDRLVGEEIPLGARIVAVADTFDALTSTRPYSPAQPPQEALALLDVEAGAQLDPEIVLAFRDYYATPPGPLPRVFAR